MDLALTKASTKPAPSRAATPLLPAWLAFLSAGTCASVAGYLLLAGGTYRYGDASPGPELATVLVMEPPLGAPAALTLAALLLLVGPALRSQARWIGAGRLVASLVAASACGAALVLLRGQLLSYGQLQEALSR